jgi:hypothetical protein
MNPHDVQRSPQASQHGRRDRLRTDAAARYLGVSRSFLEKLRLSGGGPVYSKLGKTVVYDAADLDGWADARKRASTSDRPDVA